MPIELVIFLISGSFAGILAGLFGIGGGLILIPIQIAIYQYIGLPQELQMKMAVATSLATIICGALISTIAHNRRGAVVWRLVLTISIGVILGSFLGAYLAEIIEFKVLEIFFGIISCLIGGYIFFKKNLEYLDSPHKLPHFLVMNLIGVAMGTLAALLGIGGGVIAVPLFTSFHISIKKSIGSSACLSLIVSIVGTLVFILPTIGHEIVYPHSIGYIYLPAFIPLAVTTALFAPLGVKMAHTLKMGKLKKCFAILIVIMGILMMTR